jgi:hypothetical protein
MAEDMQFPGTPLDETPAASTFPGTPLDSPTSAEKFPGQQVFQSADEVRQHMAENPTFDPYMDTGSGAANLLWEEHKNQTLTDKAIGVVKGVAETVPEILGYLSGAAQDAKDFLKNPSLKQAGVTALDALGGGAKGLASMVYKPFLYQHATLPLNIADTLTGNDQALFDRWRNQKSIELAESRSSIGQDAAAAMGIKNPPAPLPNVSALGALATQYAVPVAGELAAGSRVAGGVERGLMKGAVNAGGVTPGMTAAERAVETAGGAARTTGGVVSKLGKLPVTAAGAALKPVLGEEGAEKAGRILEVAGVALPGVEHVAKSALALEGGGKALQQAGEAAQTLAQTPQVGPFFNRFLLAAKTPNAPDWMKTLADIPAVRELYGKIQGLGPAVKSAAKAGAVGGALGVASGEEPEEIGQNIAGFGAFGGLHGAIAGRKAAIYQSRAAGLMNMVGDNLKAGVSPEILSKIPDTPALAAADLLSLIPADTQGTPFQVRFFDNATADAVGSKPGAFGHYDPASHTIFLNADHLAKSPNSWGSIFHEAFHPIFDSEVTNRPELRAQIDRMVKSAGQSLDQLKQSYMAKLEGPRLDAAGIKDQAQRDAAVKEAVQQMDALNAADPDKWIYSELLSEGARSALGGSKWMSSAEGSLNKGISQLSSNSLLQRLKDIGLQTRQGPTPASVIPDFNQVAANPEMRKTVYQLLKAQRNYIPGVTKAARQEIRMSRADIGGEKLPLNGQTAQDFLKETRPGSGQYQVRPMKEQRAIEKNWRKLMEAKYPTSGRPLPATDVSPKMALRQTLERKTERRGRELGPEFYNDPSVSNSMKERAAALEKMMAGDAQFEGWYNKTHKNGIASIEDLVTEWKQGLRPYEFFMDKQGHLLVRLYDLGKLVDDVLPELARKRGDYSLELWGGDQAEALKDVQTYLKNHAEGKPGATDIGDKKRDVLNAAIFGRNALHEGANPLRPKLKGEGKQGVVRSYRVDRLESMKESQPIMARPQWEKGKFNFSPGPEKIESPASRWRPTGKIYRGVVHSDAIDNALATGEIHPTARSMKDLATMDNPAYSQVENNFDHGFLTTKGRFVDRNEAYKIAKRTFQMKGEPSFDLGPRGKKQADSYDINYTKPASPGAEMPKLPEGDRLVTIRRPDGSTYYAAFGDKYYEFGGQKIPSIAKPVNGSWSHGVLGKDETMTEERGKQFSPEANPDVQEVADKYLKSAGIKTKQHEGYAQVNEDLAKKTADWYQAAEHTPNDPKVKKAYGAFAKETIAQWKAITDAGVVMEPWQQAGQPYKNSEEMRADVRDNKHLWFFLTEQGFGTQGANSENVAEHPMLAPTGIEVKDKPLVVNDVFRAVHDYFGHAKNGYSFGPRGELNAFLAHVGMYSKEAKPAMAVETMAQNSWVNFGAHLRDGGGNVPKPGEAAYVSPTERPFAEQKATLVPKEFIAATTGEPRAGREFDKFFSDVAAGKFGKSDVPFEPVIPLKGSAGKVAAEMENHRGNFSDHIAKSIPARHEQLVKVADGILKTYPEGARVLDIASSEGYFGKTISALSDGKITTVNLEPNDQMTADFNRISQVPGATPTTDSFLNGFEENGKEFPAHNPAQAYDVIHEDMGFQFIDKDRDAQIGEVKRMLAPDGVFVTAEKVLTPRWKANEVKKDRDFKAKYFSNDELKAKESRVGFQQSKAEVKAVGMLDNMVSDTDLEKTLKKHFANVTQYWDSGNFKGYAASDDAGKLDSLVKNIGDLNSDFSTTETPRKVFSPGDEETGRSADPFYSQLSKVVADKFPGKAMPAAQLAAILRNPQNGVKADELKWSGLDDFLRGKGRVTRQEVDDYLKANQFKLTEITKGTQKYAQKPYWEEVTGDNDDHERWSLLSNETGEDYAHIEKDGQGNGLYSLYRADSGRRVKSGDDLEALKDWGMDYAPSEISESDTRHEDYQLPGGENYREILFQLPDARPQSQEVEDLRRQIAENQKKIDAGEAGWEEASDQNKDSLRPRLAELLGMSEDAMLRTKAHLPTGTLIRFPDQRSVEEFLGEVAAQGFEHLDYGQTDGTLEVKFDSPVPHQLDDAIIKYGGSTDFPLAENRPFVSTHWNEGGIVAHTRVNDRVDTDGKPGLFMEEAQSDLHKRGRKEGYSTPTAKAEYGKLAIERDKLNDQIRVMSRKIQKQYPGSPVWIQLSSDLRAADARLEKVVQRLDEIHEAASSTIPDAPYKTSWHEMIIRRLIRMAAEDNKDWFGWTTGEQQARRYDLSKHISELCVSKLKDGTVGLNALGPAPDYPLVISQAVEPSSVADFVGKDLAEKIAAQTEQYKEYTGLDLEFGGKGMLGFYDKILTDYANKFGKKFGVQVKDRRIPGEHDASFNVPFTHRATAVRILDGGGEIYATFKDVAGETLLKSYRDLLAAENENDRHATTYYLGDKQPSMAVHSLEITPEMKKSVLEQGVAQFSPGESKLTSWVLPNGKVKPLAENFHEHDLAANAEQYNKQFGTDFVPGSQADLADRLKALTAGFVRIRNKSGQVAVESNVAAWDKQKVPTTKKLVTHADDIDHLRVNLLDKDGNLVDSASGRVFDADRPEQKIREIVGEVKAPTIPTSAAKGPGLIKRARNLPESAEGGSQRSFSPGAHQQLLGGGDAQEFPSIEKMTASEAQAHWPEAVVLKSGKDQIAPVKMGFDIVKSPLYKKAGDEKAAVNAFADKLVAEVKKHEANPSFQSGLKWYSEFTPLLRKTFGNHSELMGQLLAATSPRNNPTVNFAFAHDALEMYKKGKFSDTLKKYIQGVRMLENGTLERWFKARVTRGQIKDVPENAGPGTWLGAWVQAHDLQPRQSNGQLYGTRSMAILDVLTNRWLSTNEGPKVKNFLENLLGTGHEATIDMWAARTMRRLGYEGLHKRWRLLPKNETGVSDEDFAFSQKAFRAAADKLGIDADALQGGLWFAEKENYHNNGWAPLDLGDYRREIQKVPMLRQGIEQRLAATQRREKTKPSAQAAELGLTTAGQ